MRQLLIDMVARMELGESVVVSDETFDALVDYIDSIDHPKALKFASLPNPNQIGLKDKWIVFFKEVSK